MFDAGRKVFLQRLNFDFGGTNLIFIFLFWTIHTLKKDVKQFNRKEKNKVFFVLLIYIMFMFYYIKYINSYSNTIGYGIPGADMLAHYNGALMMSKGAKWADLALIAKRFETISISTIGYFLYTTFVYLNVFFFNVFPIGFNIYLLYLCQIILSIDACVKFSNVFSSQSKYKPISYFLVLSLCIPFVVQATQLMRDIYFMWCIAYLMENVIFYNNNKDTFTSSKKIIISAKIITLFIVCILLRYYTVMITIPLALFYFDKKDLSLTSSMGVFLLLLVGTTIIVAIKDNFGIFWDMTKPVFSECVSFLMFPNIFNQTKYLLNWDFFFGTSIDVSGCNVPGIYFIMSVWNVVIIPFAIIGVFSKWREEKKNNIIYLLILLSIVMLYSITYDAIDTRHKLFMSIPMAYLSVHGYKTITKKFKKSSIIIPFMYTLFLLLIFIISF